MPELHLKRSYLFSKCQFDFDYGNVSIFEIVIALKLGDADVVNSNGLSREPWVAPLCTLAVSGLDLVWVLLL